MADPTPIRLDRTYLLLSGERADHLAGGDAFWAQLGTDTNLLEQVSAGWLVGEYPSPESWDQWEVHPDGDEVVHLLSGEIDVHLDTVDNPTRLVAGDTIVIPRGAWHTVTVHAPARLLNITWGRDTQHRARTG